MNRKKFISSLLPLGLTAAGLSQLPASDQEETPAVEEKWNAPPKLVTGDMIGITCPGGFISLEEIEPAINKIKEWGYNIKVGETIGKRDFSRGGTDEERLADFQQMLDDRNIKAIMSARGGYGVIRIIDRINFNKYVLNPKWIIGFSDITVLHSHINRHYNIATIHSKMCNSFPSDWKLAEQVQRDSIESIGQCLAGKKMEYSLPSGTKTKNGSTNTTSQIATNGPVPLCRTNPPSTVPNCAAATATTTTAVRHKADESCPSPMPLPEICDSDSGRPADRNIALCIISE